MFLCSIAYMSHWQQHLPVSREALRILKEAKRQVLKINCRKNDSICLQLLCRCIYVTHTQCTNVCPLSPPVLAHSICHFITSCMTLNIELRE